jgi:hypothetical protein
MPDAVLGCGCPEAFPEPQHVDGFQEIGLALAVAPHKQACARGGTDLQPFYIAVLKEV